jgi:hypothetical protein
MIGGMAGAAGGAACGAGTGVGCTAAFAVGSGCTTDDGRTADWATAGWSEGAEAALCTDAGAGCGAGTGACAGCGCGLGVPRRGRCGGVAELAGSVWTRGLSIRPLTLWLRPLRLLDRLTDRLTETML